MEDFYKELHCSSDVTTEELKTAFQKLARIHHPDKVMQQGASPTEAQTHASTFAKIDKAWKVLGNPELRKEYDAKWQQRCLAQQWPLQDEIDFEEFCEEDDSFTYDCRCGGQYILTDTDVSFRVDYVCCESCSLCIKIIYPEDSTPEDTSCKS